MRRKCEGGNVEKTQQKPTVVFTSVKEKKSKLK